MNNSLRICLCLCLTAGFAWGLPSGMDSQAVGQNSVQAKEDFLDGVYSDCINKGSVSCVKYKLFAYVDKALNKDEINLTEGVTVVRTSGAPGEGAPRSLEDDGEQKDVDTMVVKRVQRFLNEHSIKVDIKGADIVNAVSRTGKSISDAISQFVGDDENATEESRGKKSKFHTCALCTTRKYYLPDKTRAFPQFEKRKRCSKITQKSSKFPPRTRI